MQKRALGVKRAFRNCVWNFRVLNAVHLDRNRIMWKLGRLIRIFSVICVQDKSDFSQPLLLPKYASFLS